jgi:hypothetical protein
MRRSVQKKLLKEIIVHLGSEDHIYHVGDNKKLLETLDNSKRRTPRPVIMTPMQTLDSASTVEDMAMQTNEIDLDSVVPLPDEELDFGFDGLDCWFGN